MSALSCIEEVLVPPNVCLVFEETVVNHWPRRRGVRYAG